MLYRLFLLHGLRICALASTSCDEHGDASCAASSAHEEGSRLLLQKSSVRTSVGSAQPALEFVHADLQISEATSEIHQGRSFTSLGYSLGNTLGNTLSREFHQVWSFIRSEPWLSEKVPWLIPGSLLAICTLFSGLAISSIVKDQRLGFTNRCAVLCIILSCFLRYVDYTLVIPTVYDLTRSAGGSAAVSGFIVSSSWVATLPGVLVHQFTPVHQMSFRRVFILGMAVYPLTSAIYVASAYVPPGPLTLLLMITSRCIAGIAEGVLGLVSGSALAHVSPSSCISKVFLFYTFTECLGNTCGPMASSLCLDFLAPHSALNVNVLPSAVMGCIHVAALPLAMLLLPSPEAMAIAEAVVLESKEEEGESDSSDLLSAAMSIAVVVAMYALAGGLESATALILEVQYSWRTVWIGYAIAMCFACFLPIYLLWQAIAKHVSRERIQTFALIAICAMTVLLFPQVCMISQSKLHFVGTCATFLLASDCFVYPLASIVTGLAEAHAYECVSSEQAENIAAVQTVGSALSYLVIQPLVRYLAEGGVSQYACLQILLAVLALLANCSMARDHILRHCQAKDERAIPEHNLFKEANASEGSTDLPRSDASSENLHGLARGA